MTSQALTHREADVVIVGAGASGSAMAARLAAGGKQVILLEAGPDRKEADMVSSSIWSRRMHWAGEPVLESGENPVGHVFNAGYGVGGSALHHFAVWPRMHDADFEMQSRFGRGLDWPIRYEDLRPWYDEVQLSYGVAGDASQEKWRPPGSDYPMPPVPLFAQGEIIARGFKARGQAVAPIPLAITTRDFAGRPPCIWDGWCESGCPIGALANPLSTDLPKARSHGVNITTDATVSRILTDDSGQRAIGVQYHASDGTRFQVNASLVVLAAFAVQNPRLLLASATDHHPSGLGNAGGLVGRYIMTHPGALIYGLFDEPTQCHKGATGGQLINQDAYVKTHHQDQGAFGSYSWLIAQAVKPTDLLGIATTRPDLFGDDLHAFMKNAAHHFATMTGVIEDLPVADNRVELSEQKDRFGTPLARVTHTTHPDSKRLWQAALEEGQEIFRAAGAREVWTGPQASMHVMGGTIMGEDPARSVCNGFGQTHDIANLVIAGPGLFPSSAGVNPTFTIQALAARSSHHLLQNWDTITA